MDDFTEQLAELKGRLNRLENIAYILGGLAVALGLAGASLFTSLGEARSEAAGLRTEMSDLRTEINEDLSDRVEPLVEGAFATAMESWGEPWISKKISANSQVVTKKARFCAVGSVSTYINARQTDAHCELSFDPEAGVWTLDVNRKDNHINMACQMICFGIDS